MSGLIKLFKFVGGLFVYVFVVILGILFMPVLLPWFVKNEIIL